MMSFETKDNFVNLALNKNDLEYLFQVLLFQSKYNENVKEKKISQLEDGLLKLSDIIQKLQVNIELSNKIHEKLVVKFDEEEKKRVNQLEKLENKLMKIEENVNKTIEKFNFIVDKMYPSFNDIDKKDNNEIKNISGGMHASQTLQANDNKNYDSKDSLKVKNNITSIENVLDNSSSETICSGNNSFVWCNNKNNNEYFNENDNISILDDEYCKKINIDNTNSNISSVSGKNFSNQDIEDTSNIPYSEFMNCKNNMKSTNIDIEKDNHRDKKKIIKDSEPDEVKQKKSYRFSEKEDVYLDSNTKNNQNNFFDDLNEIVNESLNLLSYEKCTTLYNSKHQCSLTHCGENLRTRHVINNLTCKMLFNPKEKKYILVIERLNMNNLKLVFEIDTNIQFYFSGKNEIICDYSSNNCTSKKSKMWMFKFINDSDYKEFINTVTYIKNYI